MAGEIKQCPAGSGYREQEEGNWKAEIGKKVLEAMQAEEIAKMDADANMSKISQENYQQFMALDRLECIASGQVSFVSAGRVNEGGHSVSV